MIPVPSRISLVSETYLPQVNGVSRSLDRLSRHLTAGGTEVQVIAPRYRERTALPIGATLHGFPSVAFPPYPEVRLCGALPRHLGAAFRRFGPQAVHIATEGPLGLAALLAARTLRIPVVSSFHTHFPRYLGFYGLGGLTPAAWRYLRWFHNRTCVTLCPTPSIRGELAGHGVERLVVWGRGVDAAFFRPELRSPDVRSDWGARPEDVVLQYVGRLAPEKNLDTLLDAFECLPPGLKCRLVLVGDGPARQRLRTKAGERVVFTGYRTGEALAQAFASADVFVFPSLTDTFGNVLLEAMASGLPAVAFRAPGPGDVIREGETGLFAEGPDARALGRSIATLAADAGRRRAMASAARSWATTQTWEAANETVVDEYRRAARWAA